MIKMITGPEEWILNDPNAKGLDRTFKTYQRIIQARLDIIDIRIKNIDWVLSDPYCPPVMQSQMESQRRKLYEVQWEWLNLDFGKYLKLLDKAQNNNLGWRVPGC
jgi:hypothetical protein